jgi:hypothetical protein
MELNRELEDRDDDRRDCDERRRMRTIRGSTRATTRRCPGR